MALGWWSLRGGRRSQGPRRGDGQAFRGEEPHLWAEGRVGEAEELPSLERGSSWAEGRAAGHPALPARAALGQRQGCVTPPRTGDSGAVSGRPGPWGSSLLVCVCLHSHLSSASTSHRPLSGAHRSQRRRPPVGSPWAGFITFLSLVSSSGKWDKATTLQGCPKEHMSRGAAPGSAPSLPLGRD